MSPDKLNYAVSANETKRSDQNSLVTAVFIIGGTIVVSLFVAAHFIRASVDTVAQQVFLARGALRDQHDIQTEQLLHTILSSPRYADPRHLAHFEAKVYSQNGEDGVIREIFHRIGETNRIFAEFGSSDGVENNTVLPLTLGWSGLWIDGDSDAVARARERFAPRIASKQLKTMREFVTAENIESHFAQAGLPHEFDLLSIDIDRNDLWVWDAITHYSPRVVVIEYNGIFPPDVDWVIPYDPSKWWDYTAYTGASLAALERVGRKKGYTLVDCDLSGTNAFFIRTDLVGDKFPGPFTAGATYQPPRYYMAKRLPGHPRNPH
jgi:hypothetical protein